MKTSVARGHQPMLDRLLQVLQGLAAEAQFPRGLCMNRGEIPIRSGLRVTAFARPFPSRAGSHPSTNRSAAARRR